MSQQLSPREIEVVNLVMQGKSNKQIAWLLDISVRTVEFHLKNVYAKQQVNSRVELILALTRASSAPGMGELGESTVDREHDKVHNGSLNALDRGWKETLKIIFSLIQKEIAMTKIILPKELAAIAEKHPLMLSVGLLLMASFTARYLLISLGLYFWLSYILLALLLSIGSVYLGLSIHKVGTGQPRFHPLVILGIILIPVVIALIDITLLHSVARATGEAAIHLGSISNQALWLSAPDGQSYLFRERVVRNDHIWLLATLDMFLLFGLGVFVRDRKGRRKIAA